MSVRERFWESCRHDLVDQQPCPLELVWRVSRCKLHIELTIFVLPFQLTDNMQSSFIPGAVGSASGPGWWSTGEEVFRFEG